VSFTQHHNEANGEGNKDGSAENYAANWGVEGATTDEKIKELRARVRRAMLATVMFAHGTPMLLAGDEFGRTQSGNNNAYCQDNEISWLDWVMADSPEGREMISFVSKLIAVRQEHTALRSRHFLHGHREPAPGIFDIAWFNEDGENVPEASWTNPEHRLLCLRRATRNGDRTVSVLTLLLNPTAEERVFQLPQPALPGRVLIDTAQPNTEAELKEPKVEVKAHSAVLLYAKLEPATQ
jgi:glycogen operon protein